jgi:hypothetical protein
MRAFIKFSYYNLFLGLSGWLLSFLYTINTWLTAFATVILIYFFIIITSKVLFFINNL